jgi:uncharacterized protein YwbE
MKKNWKKSDKENGGMGKGTVKYYLTSSIYQRK